MPAILLRLLPHALAVAAILGGLWYIDLRGYQRAQADAARERLITALMLTRAVRQTEAQLGERLAVIASTVDVQIAGIEQLNRTDIRPTIVKELSREIRFTDPAAGIPDSVREAINRGIAASTCAATADGGIRCPLPGPAAAADQ